MCKAQFIQVAVGFACEVHALFDKISKTNRKGIK